jgi:hypothetical protein
LVFVRQDTQLRIMGIHLAGANTKKSAIVRTSVLLSRILSGLPKGMEHEIFKETIASYFPNLPVDPNETGHQWRNCISPLFWEAFSPDIGATSFQDSDSRLLEAISDHGGAHIFCIDAPLSLPPCISCSLICPGTMECPTKTVSLMRREWESSRKLEKKVRIPQPYVDRYFETFARNYFEKDIIPGSLEFEAVLASGKAPLTARALRVARELQSRFPHALVIETNSQASTIGWGAICGVQNARFDDFKSIYKGAYQRRGIIKNLESFRYAVRSAGIHESLLAEIPRHLEVFLAAISAQSAWGLLSGLVIITPEFLSLDASSPFRGWPCLPKGILAYAPTQTPE